MHPSGPPPLHSMTGVGTSREDIPHRREGQLGTELIAQAAAHGMDILAPPLAKMDLTRPEQIDPFWDDFQPEAVINAAAYTRWTGLRANPIWPSP